LKTYNTALGVYCFHSQLKCYFICEFYANTLLITVKLKINYDFLWDQKKISSGDTSDSLSSSLWPWCVRYWGYLFISVEQHIWFSWVDSEVDYFNSMSGKSQGNQLPRPRDET